MGKLFDMEFTGIDEAQASFAAMRKNLEREGAVRKVMVEALAPILGRLKADLPRSDISHAHMADQLVINVDIQSAPGTVRAEIGINSGASLMFAMRLRLTEFGTSEMGARPVVRATWDAEQEAYIGRVIEGLGRLMANG